MSRVTIALATIIALVVVTSIAAFPLLVGSEILGSPGPGSVDSSDSNAPGADRETQSDGDGEPPEPQESGLISMAATTPDADQASLAQEKGEAIERGVDRAVEILQRQNVEITQDQRAAAIDGARESVRQHQSADVEQVQRATTGAVHGALLQKQRVNATQIQSIVSGATGGALSQHQTANATQMQHATWGAAHGTAAQEQKVTVEQLQVAARGAAAGAAHEAGEADEGEAGKIQEAAQGAAYGVLEQYQKVTVEQRQRITVEHVQNAAAGASAGALEGSQRTVVDQSQRVEVTQRQRVTIKEIQKAAMGAAGGAIDQKQTVNVRQTQVAARGAAKGACKKVQTQRVKQVQKVSITQIQEASYGAAKGSIAQSQDASIEQIQAAAEGSAAGVLQSQRVTVVQTQHAAIGAAQGAVESAVQNQVVDVEQVQAAARGAGQGAVIQIQVVNVVQVQAIAWGASSGSLSQSQSASVRQIQTAAKSAGTSTAKQIQNQRVSVEQIQRVTETVAADTTRHAVDAGTDDERELESRAVETASESVAAVEDLEGTATVSIADQTVQAQTVVVDSVQLSDGGYVVIHDDDAIVGPAADTVLGVSRYLEPGEHESVEIELAQPLADNRSVVAMAHRDTTGDQEFAFVESDGAEDDPYIGDSGSPVSERATLVTPPEEAGDGAAEDAGDADQPDGETESDEIIDADETDDNETAGVDDGGETDDDATETDDGVNETDEPDDGVTESDDTDDVAIDATGELVVESQSGDGTNLTVTEANASVAYAIRATYGGERVETEPFDANESVENATLDLEPPLDDDATVNVSVVDVASGELLVAEEIEYTVEPGDEPTVDLVVEDQSGDGTNLTVTEANASVDFYLEASYDGVTVETDVFGAGEALENETLDLEPPLEENATVDVAVRAAADDVELANASIEYGVLEDPTAEIEFESQVSAGSNVTVDAVNLSDGGYVTIYDESVLTEDPAPDEPPIEVSPEAVVGVSEYLEPGEYENVTVELFDVPGAEDEPSELEPGDATLVAVAHQETTPDEGTADEPFDEPPYDYVETDGEADGPYLDDEDVPVFDDAVVTVEESADSADTDVPSDAAGDGDAGQPATFAITDLSAPDSAQQGAGIDVVATIRNQGGEAATQTVSYAVDGEVLGQTEVTLGAGETILLTFEYVIPADYPTGAASHTVETGDDAATTTVTVESADGQATVTAPSRLGRTGTVVPG